VRGGLAQGPEVRALCERIKKSQAEEIQQMKAMLESLEK
jgi:uncharacterized protein (DUF305 family)